MDESVGDAHLDTTARRTSTDRWGVARAPTVCGTRPAPKVISLFSGAGGLDLGLTQAGLNVIWANDFDPDCVATYERNLGRSIVGGDITKIKASAIPDADVVVGGFPCQGFSMANMRRNGDDERNNLYRQFLRVLRAKRPSYFLAENVRGILSLDGGTALAEILRGFRGCGYRVEHQVLNAADFGVPQARRRVIFFGMCTDLPRSLDLAYPIPTHTSKPQVHGDRKPWVSISEALVGLPEPGDPHGLFNHVCSQYKVANRNFTGHRVTDPQKPSPTILARGNGRGGVCAIPHPGNHRRMSVRESAIVQTFPDDFEFTGALNSMYRQVGNAVPVRLARHLGQQIIEAWSRGR